MVDASAWPDMMFWTYRCARLSQASRCAGGPAARCYAEKAMHNKSIYKHTQTQHTGRSTLRALVSRIHPPGPLSSLANGHPTELPGRASTMRAAASEGLPQSQPTMVSGSQPQWSTPEVQGSKLHPSLTVSFHKPQRSPYRHVPHTTTHTHTHKAQHTVDIRARTRKQVHVH